MVDGRTSNESQAETTHDYSSTHAWCFNTRSQYLRRGSACGKNMSKETTDTLGNQKKMNYALNQPDKVTFIKAVTDGLLPPPGYFGMNVAMNKKGYESFETVLSNGMLALTPDEFEAEKKANGEEVEMNAIN